MYNDLFTSLVNFISSVTVQSEVLCASLLLAMLSTYSKHETVNPYQSRLKDFINEEVMQKIIECVGSVSRNSRESYIAIQDDTADGLVGSVTKIVGGYVPFGLAARLGLSPSKTPTPPTTEDPEETLRKLYFPFFLPLMKSPDSEVAVLLMSYEFIHTNKAFSINFIRSPASPAGETPFGLFLSVTSYLATQQSRSARATLYSRLALLSIRHLIDDSSLLGLLHHEDTKSRIRMCRQRQPFLPIVAKERTLVEGILDVCVCGMDHNLRRRLDVEFYL
jgi:hypothetical protein